eukprot:gnl/Chilomastix_cuspidata/69.p1 GENE.gnl/Chilomastix_cuspidata/69~~gnl/Chilomastix_cuspidata/69.p1  ORF type:complete len:588 (-),score=72.71 gnl/Chilomastix_cuspidata/69:2071-3834(-)
MADLQNLAAAFEALEESESASPPNECEVVPSSTATNSLLESLRKRDELKARRAEARRNTSSVSISETLIQNLIDKDSGFTLKTRVTQEVTLGHLKTGSERIPLAGLRRRFTLDCAGVQPGSSAKLRGRVYISLVAVELSPARTSASGRRFASVRCSDLINNEVSLALFGAAFERYYELPAGMLFLLLNPDVYVSKPTPRAAVRAPARPLSLSASDSSQIVPVGIVATFGFCSSLCRTTGARCRVAVNTAHSSLCSKHLGQQVSRAASNRARTGASAPRLSSHHPPSQRAAAMRQNISHGGLFAAGTETDRASINLTEVGLMRASRARGARARDTATELSLRTAVARGSYGARQVLAALAKDTGPRAAPKLGRGATGGRIILQGTRTDPQADILEQLRGKPRPMASRVGSNAPSAKRKPATKPLLLCSNLQSPCAQKFATAVTKGLQQQMEKERVSRQICAPSGSESAAAVKTRHELAQHARMARVALEAAAAEVADQKAERLRVHEIHVTVYRCSECQSLFRSKRQHCIDAGHTFEQINTVKRFFKCTNCSKRIFTLGGALPERACPRCSGRRWKRSTLGATIKHRK